MLQNAQPGSQFHGDLCCESKPHWGGGGGAKLKFFLGWHANKKVCFHVNMYALKPAYVKYTLIHICMLA
jgi:hypothetical protein